MTIGSQRVHTGSTLTEIKEPQMPKTFVVVVTQSEVVKVRVEAASEEEAKRLVCEGEGEEFDCDDIERTPQEVYEEHDEGDEAEA